MKAFLRIASFIYFALLFYIFFLARRRPHPSLASGHRSLNLKPVSNKIWELRHFSIHSRYDWNYYVNFFGNIILFIPLAFILSVVFGVKSSRKIIFICLGTSICVETIQYILNIGVADIDDVILNTIGALLGVLFLKFLKRLNYPFINKFLYPA